MKIVKRKARGPRGIHYRKVWPGDYASKGPEVPEGGRYSLLLAPRGRRRVCIHHPVSM